MTWRLVDTATLARMLAMSEDYVRDHAGEFGAIRMGGPRSPLRFDVDRVRAALDRRRVTKDDRPGERRRPGPRRQTDGVELLPLPKEDA